MRPQFLFVFALILVACTSTGQFTGQSVKLYKSPTCGCCVGYSSFLESQGFDVDVIELNDLSAIKQKYGIPRSMESCHTTVVGEYFIEGHVPEEALVKLMKEQPDISGIALPNMPSGTPGMPGPKNQPYKVYALNSGEWEEYITV